MNEKIATADILNSVNQLITHYTYSIVQGDNENLRNVFCDHRNKLEMIQYNLYNVGKQKGYYVPALPAGANDIEQVTNELNK